MQQRGAREVFTPSVVTTLGILLLAAAVGYSLPGSSPNALREEFAVGILFLTLAGWSLFHGLRGGSTTPRASYPRAEAILLTIGILFFVGTIGFLLGNWTFTLPLFGDDAIPTANLVEWLLIGLIMITARPRFSDLGLRHLTHASNWFLVLLIGAVGYVAAVNANFTGFDQHLVDLPRRLLLVVLPAELFYRALLQTRLSYLMEPGWALLVQAVLFHVVRIPLLVYEGGLSWPLASLHLLPHLVIGILTGIVWLRTRSLYLCVLLHLFLVY